MAHEHEDVLEVDRKRAGPVTRRRDDRGWNRRIEPGRAGSPIGNNRIEFQTGLCSLSQYRGIETHTLIAHELPHQISRGDRVRS